ncbi:MAG: hypothetical protein IE914_00325 [Thiotrichales bacterium]|nr:hypothetical protein [Thiotrichales bacterium]
MDLRQKIEQLALWYLAALCLTPVLTALMPLAFNVHSKAMLIAGTPVYFSVIAGLLKSFVCAIWLYSIAKHDDTGRTWIWFVLGFTTDLFAVVIYIGLKLYELQSQKAHTHIHTPT